MTGVPVMPSGSMLPQGKLESGTGVPRLVCHWIAPVVALSEYTESFSVATNTLPPETSGSA